MEKINIPIRHRISRWCFMKIGWIDAKLWMFKSNFKRFVWFQKRAFRCLFAKEGIIDSREVRSRGGYKYLQIEITKVPLSKTDTIS
jgi:hypothetical protein